MSDLSVLQYVLVALIFVWSGFVRSGLGFGGSVMSLPFLLLVDDRPLVFLPIISVHLLFFASLTIYLNNKQSRQRVDSNKTVSTAVTGTVDWSYLKNSLVIMLIPKLIGVFGLITLPHVVMSAIIFIIVGCYAVSYVLARPFISNSKTLDIVFLALGGYISGTSLIGAPLIIAVYSRHVAREQLRDTLFALWFILVSIKMCALVWAGIDLQLIHALALLPVAGLGHVFGLRLHTFLLKAETKVFYRVLGVVLLLVSIIGLFSVLS